MNSDYLEDIKQAIKANRNKQTKSLLNKAETKTFIRTTLIDIGEIDNFEESKF